jgi:predicted permease
MTLPLATSEPDTRARSYQQLLEALRGRPAIEAATAMSGLPFEYENPSQKTPIENYTSPTGEPWEIVFNQLVMSDYFETMRIPIVEGRTFDRTDVASRRSVVVVNETLARTVWKGRSPIGSRVRPLVYGVGQLSWHTVIGVAKDVSQMSVNGQTRPELYIFAEEEQAAPATMHVIVRTPLSPAALIGTLQRLVTDIDPAVPISRLRDMDDVFAESIGRPRLLAQLLGGFAVLGLVLAAVGTYGLLSYIVAQRRREIGVRMALGAARSTVMVLILKQGSLLIVGGIALGLAGAMAGSHLLESLLFGVEPNDVATVAAVVTAIAAVAALACGLPAWRASRVDPAITLRAE